MTLNAQSPTRAGSTAPAAGLARARRGSLSVLVLITAEYGTGMYVNLYATIPRADHGHGLGSAFTNGPRSSASTPCSDCCSGSAHLPCSCTRS